MAHPVPCRPAFPQRGSGLRLCRGAPVAERAVCPHCGNAETAKEVGADDDAEALERAFKKIAPEGVRTIQPDSLRNIPSGITGLTSLMWDMVGDCSMMEARPLRSKCAAL
jgi:hypothetical protein